MRLSLPRWRGASPVAHAILAGDPETGVSIMRMDAGILTPDRSTRTGASCDRRFGDNTGADARAGQPGGKSVARCARRPCAGKRGGATAIDGRRDVRPAPRARRRSRGLVRAQRSRGRSDGPRAANHGPAWWHRLPASMSRCRKALRPDSAFGFAGEVVRHEGESVVVQTRDGGYRIDLITPPGKRAMTPAAFLRGAPLMTTPARETRRHVSHGTAARA